MKSSKEGKAPLREKISFERVEREKLVTAQKEDVDGVVEISLRPKKIAEFVGQESLKENLGIALQAAKKRKERAGDLIGILTNLEEGDILFIDEIHRLSKVVEEFVYPAMEDFKIDFVVDKGPYAKTIKFSLKHFTLIGATTRQGLLSAPLRDRFGVAFHLDFYEPGDLTQIIERSAKLLSIPIEKEAAFELARRSRGTPRIANKLLRRVRDYAEVKSLGRVTLEIVDKALLSQGIDKSGLDNLDRKVLKAIIEIYSGGPVGIESLAATLNEEVDTIVDVVEPFLLKSGFLKRTARGRETTPLAHGSSSRDLFASQSK